MMHHSHKARVSDTTHNIKAKIVAESDYDDEDTKAATTANERKTSLATHVATVSDSCIRTLHTLRHTPTQNQNCSAASLVQ